jgi:hypothetical protein
VTFFLSDSNTPSLGLRCPVKSLQTLRLGKPFDNERFFFPTDSKNSVFSHNVAKLSLARSMGRAAENPPKLLSTP